MNRNQLMNHVKDYSIIFLGLLIYGFAWQGFIFSHEIVTGGLAGITSLISFATGIPVWIPYNLINIGLMVLALFVLGPRFLAKTIFSVICLGILIPFFEIIFRGIPAGASASQMSFYRFMEPLIVGEPLLRDQPFMAVLIGGMLCGLSLGMVFSVNGSTGGTDIIAAIINKYRSVTIGRALLLIDAVIIGSSYFIFHSADKLVFSLVEVMACNLTLDYYLNGYRQSVQFFIISKHYKEISQRILREVNRGCTLLNGEGAYSGGEVKVMMVIAKKSESNMIFRAVKETDPKAFISQSIVRGVYGEGFDVIKVGGKSRPKKTTEHEATLRNTQPS